MTLKSEERKVILDEFIYNATDSTGTLSITDSPSEEWMRDLFEEYYDLKIKHSSILSLLKHKLKLWF